MNLNNLRDKAYQTACSHGFHDEELSNEHWLMLVITELSEAVEADRKGNHFDFENNDFDCYCRAIDKQGFLKAFEDHIKDTVEDELSDAVIRLLDFYGLRKINIDEDAFDKLNIIEYSITYERKSFTESIFHITNFICSHRGAIEHSSVVPEMMLLEIFGFAKHLGIDILWHIEQKMKYNESRKNKHGKKY